MHLLPSDLFIFNILSKFIEFQFSTDCNFVFLNYKNSQNFEEFHLSLVKLFENPSFVIFYVNQSIPLSSYNERYKYTTWCNIIYLDLKNLMKKVDEILKISQDFFYTLTPRLGPITRKDEDYYFIQIPIGILQELVKIPFLQKIKFKLLFCKDQMGIRSFYSQFFPWPGEDLAIEHSNFEIFLKSIKVQDLFPDLLKNFKGRKIRVSAPTSAIFTVEIAEKNGKWFALRGHQKLVLEEICSRFNLTFDLMKSSGGGITGYKLPNGTYVGTLGDIFYDRADLAFITGQLFSRYHLIGFSKPFYFPAFAFTVGIPKNIYSYKTILNPFSSEIWALFALTNCLFFSIFLLSNKYSKTEKSLQNHQWEFSKTIEFTIGAIFEQGLVLTEKKTARIFCLLLLIFLIVLSTLYKAKLFTFLIYPEMTKPPETFEELTQRSEFKFGLERAGIGAAIHATLKSSKNEVFSKINREMSLEFDSVGCFLKGLYSNFACLAYTGQFEYIFYKNFSTPSGKFPFKQSKERTLVPHASGYAMETRSVFRTNFDRIFGPLLDCGIINKMEKTDFENVRLDRVKWQKTHQILPIFTDQYFYTGPKKLNIAQLNGVFLIHLIFTCTIIPIFLFEMISKFLKKFQFRLLIS